MALSARPLAKKIADALEEDTVSKQLVGWAKAVVTEVTSGVAGFGGIPGPHAISGLVGPRLAKLIAKEAGYPGVTPELIKYATAITTYIMSAAKVTYKAPPPNGMGAPDWFIGGTISGMSGQPLAQAIAKAEGYPDVSEQLLKKSTAIVEYIQANAGVQKGAIS